MHNKNVYVFYFLSIYNNDNNNDSDNNNNNNNNRAIFPLAIFPPSLSGVENGYIIEFIPEKWLYSHSPFTSRGEMAI
jgi:hypothetical protein